MLCVGRFTQRLLPMAGARTGPGNSDIRSQNDKLRCCTHRVRRATAVPGCAERVRRSLIRHGLRLAYPRPWKKTADSAHRLPAAANGLSRRFGGGGVNQAWTPDITYLPTAEGASYLVAGLALGSRRIVGWSIGERCDLHTSIQLE